MNRKTALVQPAKQIIAKESSHYFRKLSSPTLIAIMAAMVGLDTIFPIDLPFFIDELLLGTPFFAALAELKRRYSQKRAQKEQISQASH